MMKDEEEKLCSRVNGHLKDLYQEGLPSLHKLKNLHLICWMMM